MMLCLRGSPHTTSYATAEFCAESRLTGVERPYSRPAAYACLAGVLLHLLACPGRG
jgi:hypothetical protein